MSERQTRTMRQLAREKALFRYSSALNRGDFWAVAAVLHEAERDAVLERMILEVNDVYQSEDDTAAQAEDVAVVRQLIREHLPLGVADEGEVAQVPPLTVGDVIARLQADVAQKGRKDQELTQVTHQLQQPCPERSRRADDPLPEDLSLRGIRQLFERIGLNVSQHFQKLFRQTAIFLSMGREQGQLRLAETRRQYRTTPQSKSVTPQHKEES